MAPDRDSRRATTTLTSAISEWPVRIPPSGSEPSRQPLTSPALRARPWGQAEPPVTWTMTVSWACFSQHADSRRTLLIWAMPAEALLALRPVTFHFKPELDNTRIPQFGLVAEEVAKVNPDLVTHDAKGELSTVRYEAVNAMLLNEFLKEHRTVQELKSNAAKQEATIGQQQKQIEALTAGLQKVSAQLEAGKPGTQTALNNNK